MEHLSSPDTVTSPTAAPPGSATKQPTYTTAGTLYDPTSSQPLQPPARRGRSFKWANGGIHTDLALLPKSVLASLPLRAAASRTPVLQQYSPLQQNYDRAVSPSPFHDPDHILAKMPIDGVVTPLAKPVTPLPSLLVGSSEDKSVHEDDSDDSDNESELGNPLVGMTVKSLQNLASYPNPNQKKARKALRGAKPSALQGLTGRGPSPKANASTMPPIGSPPKSHVRPFEMPLPKPLTLPVLSYEKDKYLFAAKTSLVREKSETSAQDIISDNKSRSSTLADGPGAPRPLTAGPPGQRQYRPSTFDTTFKALERKGQQSRTATSDGEPSYLTKIGMFARPDEEPRFPSLASNPFRANRSASPSAHSVAASQKGHPDKRATSPDAAAYVEALKREEDEWFTNDLVMATHGQKHQWIPRLRDTRSQNQLRFVPGTDRLTQTEIASRNERINQCWYSGTDMLGKSTAEAVADEKFRRLQRNLGAIGEGRPGKAKAEYEVIDIEQANRATAAEHAKPLLNLAFVGLLRSTDESWQKQAVRQR